MKILILLLMISCVVHAQEAELSPNEWNEVNSIISEIKTQNPPRNLRAKLKMGLIQSTLNTTDTRKLMFGGTLPATGIELVSDIWNGFGIEVRGTYAQNVTPLPSSLNKSNAGIYWLSVGPRYTLFFDNTKLDNNLAFKVLFHQSEGSFSVEDPYNDIFVQRYQAVAFGVERSIPITKRLGVLASFDLLQIFLAKSGSAPLLRQYGYGFELQGEIYYQIQLFNQPIRLGASYWQQGNENELQEDSDKSRLRRNTQFQVYRALFLNLSMLY